MPRQVLHSRRVLTSRGVEEALVVLVDGRIEAIERPGTIGPTRTFGDLVIMPALFDTHVHLNEPGRTDWEGIETGTRAAAAGGIASVIDMPLNSSPVTTSAAALRAKRRAAEAARRSADLGFWGGVIPGNAGELEGLAREGALGFKAFLIHSGLDEFPATGEEDLRLAMRCLRDLDLPLLAHAELDTGRAPPAGDSRSYRAYLESRPKEWENRAVELLIRLCRETGCRTHIVHLSSAGALEAILRAKEEGLDVTAETCPHYLHFCAEEIADAATEFKCAPPIRERENREALWSGLKKGIIDFVVADHSPCSPRLKTSSFVDSWGGIAALELSLPATWTAARERGYDLDSLARWLCERPALFAAQGARKGRIERGFDADLVVWDPEASFKVEASHLRQRHPVSPYVGRELLGRVEATFLRGEPIFERGQSAAAPRGRLLGAAA